MARRHRVSSAGVDEHIIQRGNNRQVIFASEEDIQAYVGWLKTYSKKYNVSIHAWVLMTNHVHILCTPSNISGISQMMQSLGRMYVAYFNRRYKRTGTLWEGRFKSCLVQEETYLLQVSRYIELNPVRASMVDDPADYFWSSYQCNALGKKSELLTPHPIYTRLGGNEKERQASYRSLFASQIEDKLLEDIRQATNKGLALGNEHFLADIEALTGRRVSEGKRGRPVDWRKNKIWASTK
ncbi:transposase [Marinomonas sp. 2405UD68-3]|uniref:transposase n=1 Tax=Marinomonas sp. 2405UD68-3 TaxID=3391835 RepID=UPI0039C97335